MSNEVAEFYDKFADKQMEWGINRRHKSIDQWLERFGVNDSDHVLEIGCGIGTVTGLMANRVTQGQIVGIDLSEKSIEIAKKRLAAQPQCRFMAGDVITMEIAGTFHIIVMPDVLEHIPIETHPQLFKKLCGLLRDDGYILIHIPDPFYLQSQIDGKFKGLQVIDQPIHTDMLAQSVYPAGLYIEFLESYDLHVENHDYQVIKLRKVQKKNYPPKSHSGSFADMLISRIKRALV